jgi:uncharacterized membrane protein
VRADLDIDLINFADTRRIIKMELIDVPEGWDIGIWNAFFDFTISEIVVEPSENTPGQRPRLRVNMPDDPRPPAGDYSFTLVLTDVADPSIEYDRAKFTIGVPELLQVEAGEVRITTDFPILRGPASSTYEFEIQVFNDTGEDRSFELSAQVVIDGVIQQGWQIGFTPSFGQAKQISSVSVLSSLNERVNVEITPPFFATPGDYLIPVAAEGDEFAGAALLQLTLTGRGELTATTASGRLNLDATAGDEAEGTLRLGNIGTGDIANIGLLADTPPDWVIVFEIDNYESLPKDNIIDIRYTLKPPSDAIPGDYLITLRGRSQDSVTSVDIRVTVDQSTIWGWLGIVLVLAVLGGLGGLFWRLGRR